MLLERTLARNPELVAAAIELHQRGEVPAGSYVVDLDAVARNASLLAAEARRCRLRTYLMTKSYGRNPFITRIALEQGIDSTVAVEAREAYLIHRYELPVGHVGHLGAVPLREAAAIVGMAPEVVTVFTVEAARAIARAAEYQGRTQALYVRVNGAGDESFRGFVGGWRIDRCVEEIAPILELPGVRIAGVTSYPCLDYAVTDPAALTPNSTFRTLLTAKDLLERGLGLEGLRVNAPAINGCTTFELLARHGATDAEPGHALLGGGLVHAHHDLPEKPAQVYVSEVTHRWGGELYALGGGMLYLETFGGARRGLDRCLVGASFERAVGNVTQATGGGHVDYYVLCDDVADARPGDSVVFALHPQYFLNRAYVAAVRGIAASRPRVEGLFDWACNGLDAQLSPLRPSAIVERIGQVASSYRMRPSSTAGTVS